MTWQISFFSKRCCASGLQCDLVALVAPTYLLSAVRSLEGVPDNLRMHFLLLLLLSLLKLAGEEARRPPPPPLLLLFCRLSGCIFANIWPLFSSPLPSPLLQDRWMLPSTKEEEMKVFRALLFFGGGGFMRKFGKTAVVSEEKK